VQFAEIAVDEPDLAYPPNPSMTLDFTFREPAQTARALLQGFHFGYELNDRLLDSSTDRHLRAAKVKLTTHFSPGDRSGSVEISLAFADDAYEIIGFGIHILVVGE
jgi:hypothetical protein